MKLLSDNIFILLTIASALHVLEEFVYPGGFAREFRHMLNRFHLQASNAWLVLTNALFILVVVSTLVWSNQMFGLSVISITLINGFLHVGKSIQVKGYFPGLVTALAFYLPFGIFAFGTFSLTIGEKACCLFLGLLMHLFPFLLLVTVFKSR